MCETGVVALGMALDARDFRISLVELLQVAPEDSPRSQDIHAGLDQIARGDYTEYDRTSTPKLVARVRARGRKRLAALKARKRSAAR